MRIDNENGTDEFLEILGDHLSGKSDWDVRRVQVREGKSRNLPKFICQKFINLVTIDINIHELEIQEISEEALSSCGNLEDLNLIMNQEVEIHPKTFENNTKLKHLKLLNAFEPSKISWNPAWFQSIKTLKELVITDERLSEIPRNAFNKNNKLTFIYIDNQKIQELNHESLGNLKNLVHLDVRSKEIKSLDFNIFDQPEALSVVKFEITKCTGRIDVSEFHVEKVENLRDLERCFKVFDSRIIGEELFCLEYCLILS